MSETTRSEPMVHAVGSLLNREVRPLAGVRKGHRVAGDRRQPRQRLTLHWVHSPHKRMYWCNCMPAFRVGGSVHHPRDVKGTGVPKRPNVKVERHVLMSARTQG